MILSYPSDQDPPLHSLTLSAHSCLSLSLPSHCAPCSPTHCPQPTTVPLSLPPPNPTQPRLTVRAASPRMAVRLRPVTLLATTRPPRAQALGCSLCLSLTRGVPPPPSLSVSHAHTLTHSLTLTLPRSLPLSPSLSRCLSPSPSPSHFSLSIISPSPCYSLPLSLSPSLCLVLSVRPSLSASPGLATSHRLQAL